MTESEWLASTDPAAMLAVAQKHRVDKLPISDRKLRLFAVACCRNVWYLLTDNAKCGKCDRGEVCFMDAPDVRGTCSNCHGTGRSSRSRHAVEVAERYADGEIEFNVFANSIEYAGDISQGCCGLSSAQQVSYVGRMIEELNRRVVPMAPVAALLRDICGNPFRPVRLPLKWVKIKDDPEYDAICYWFTPTVVALANRIYTDRDFDLTPMLADALAEAGCDSEEMLRHLREPMHVRGCWALDLLLGKE